MKKYTDVKREAKLLRFVWKMAKGEHGKIITVFSVNIISALIPAGIAYYLKQHIDINSLNFTKLFNKEDLILFLTLFICGIFLQTITGLIMGYTMPNIKRNIEINSIKKFAKLPHAYITDCIDNRIIMSLSIESGMISALIPMIYRSFIKAPVTILGFVTILLLVSPTLTLICLLLISTVIIGVLLFRKAIKQLNKTMYNRIGDLHQYFTEWLAGYKVFVTSNATRFIENQLISVSEELAGLSKKMTKIGAFQSITIEFITIIVAIIFVLTATQSQINTNNIFNIGELLLFPAAILFIRSETLKIIYGYVQLTGTESATRRILDIIEYPLPESPGNETIPEAIESLSFDNVSFNYKDYPENVVFNSASVSFKKGMVNTIIGRSGSGKTTFINLCMRLRLPCSGTILYNSKDINTISEENLLCRVALVEQEPFIFEGTLAENIFFDKKIDASFVLDLLVQFDLSYLAKTDIELFTTQIGQRARQLSTGEKQRIAIVRALVKNADIIFFDEVTSNLDSHNAEKIIEYIKIISKDKLTICVSHDLMLIQESQVLYEIKNGEIKCIKT